MVKIPNGAQRIIDLRMRGEIPADLVIVSLVGPLPDGNPIVIADGPEYDWRFCRNLPVCIFGKVGIPNSQTAIAVGACLPSKLFLWDVEAREGADVIVHIKQSSIDLPPAQLLRTNNWTAFLWPWSDWQNKEFQETKPCD